MDDTCAVCAESLEWVAYGPCGHREVCSTCVVRLRFICDDRKCCICKTESNVVFVTKAMGDYTRMISDFSKLPSEPREGPVPGSYWYHEDTQAFFDDVEYYKMVKAMCRLSCSVCDKAAAEEQSPQEGYRRKQRFRNIGQLKAHLNHQHRLFMCDLCLENRQVFICEQKLYTRAQLNQHRRTGDSVVDGTESERGGFSGHPMCEFCRTSFYGDGELYTHMSTDHYTCHICQRLHPGQYEYYKNYDDLECHFRQKHQLCEDETCLAKKFIVFQTPEELKRHNTLEHGGRMSRSKRNAVLQIPTSFRYRSNNDSGYHRGRRRSFLRDSSPDSELSMALERSILDDGLPNPSPSLDSVEPHDIDPLVQPYDPLSTRESEPLRYRQAVSQSSLSTPLVGSSFPPLSTPSSSQQRSLESQNTLAARLRRQNNATVLNVAQPRTGYPALRPTPAAPSLRPTPAAPSPRPAPVIPAQVSAASIPASRPAPAIPAPSTGAVTSSSSPAPASASASASSAPWPSLVPSSGSVHTNPAPLNSSGSSSYAGSLHNRSIDEPGVAMVGTWASKSKGGSSRMKHSSSVPNLVESRSFDPVSDFPPVSAVQPKRAHPSGKSMKTEDIQTANKSLVESMRAALQNDEDKFSAFKEISQEYRQNLIDTREYIEYVKQFELTHLILDMARLCPDTWKQKELLEAYNAIEGAKGSSSSKKDKGKKVIYSGESRRQESLADNVISTVKSLQSQFRPSEEVEVLEKDGYRASRGKTTISGIEDPVELRGSTQHTSTQASGNASAQALTNGGGSKQKKKTSKFHRLRLGEDSAAAILDVRNSAGESISAEVDNGPGLPSRSVWRGGGAQRLFAK